MLSELEQVGLTSQEARVYVGLLQHPASTGYELAKSIGLQRANVYQALNALVDGGFAEQIDTDPARYSAVDPADALGRIKRETARRCDSLIGELTSLQTTRSVEGFWSVRGRESVIDRAASLVADAQVSVAVSLWSEDLEWLGASLEAAARSGLRVVVNLFGETERPIGTVFSHEPPGRAVGGHVVTVSTDHNTALIASMDEPASGTYTRHPSLVGVVEKLLRDEAYLAAIFERLGPELEREFGPHLLDLRTELLPEEAARQLRALIEDHGNQPDD